MSTEENPSNGQPNESSVTEQNYPQLLRDAISKKDAEIAKLKADQFQRDKEMTERVLAGGYQKKEEQKEVEVLPTREECLKPYLENKATTNLEYWKNLLALRDATIREKGRDPFVTGSYGEMAPGQQPPSKTQYIQESEAMNEMVETIKGFIEEADGDPSKFNYLMSSAIR